MKLCCNNTQDRFNPFFLKVCMYLFLCVAISSSGRRNLSREDSW